MLSTATNALRLLLQVQGSWLRGASTDQGTSGGTETCAGLCTLPTAAISDAEQSAEPGNACLPIEMDVALMLQAAQGTGLSHDVVLRAMWRFICHNTAILSLT